MRSPGPAGYAALIGVTASFLIGCGGMLPRVAEVPVQDTGDWRVPAPEWDTLHQELLRCRRDLDRLGKRYGAQREAFTAYNTMAALLGLGGASAAISGVLDAAGVENEDLNKALGITGAVLAASGPLVFSVLSGLQNPAEVRTSYERMSAAYGAALRGRTTVLYCQTLIARTPEAATASASDAPEVLADRARFQESCATYYSVPPARGEPAPAVSSDVEGRRRRARQIIDPEYQLMKLTEQLRQQCTENVAQAATLLSPAAK